MPLSSGRIASAIHDKTRSMPPFGGLFPRALDGCAHLIERVETDPFYQSYGTRVWLSMQQRTCHMLYMLRIASRDIVPGSCAVAIRGSYARCSPTDDSDLDTILATYSESPDVVFQFDQVLDRIPKPGMCVHYSLNRVSTAGPAELKIFFQALAHLRFVSGFTGVYYQARKRALARLRALSLSDILLLYAREFATTSTCDEASPHFRDMKRGPGGQIECELVALLCLWQALRRIPLDAYQSLVPQQFRRYSRYLALLKEYVRTVAHSPTDSRAVLARSASTAAPWFFSADVSDELALAHHDIARMFLGRIPASSKGAIA